MRAPPLHKLPTQFAVATKSPWVYVLQGVDSEFVLHPSGKLSSLRAEFVTPSSLNYELPNRGQPELAFAGRSNAGKSTLIGTLTRSPKLVRTSKAPGCTKTINFFAMRSGVAPPQSYLVDLPGYGFANQQKQAFRQWNALVKGYLQTRSPDVLRRAFVLVDGRHGLQRGDENILSVLDDAGVSSQIVLTKVDKVQPAELLRAVEGACRAIMIRPSCHPVVHCISARTGLGMTELANAVWHLSSDSHQRSGQRRNRCEH